MWRGSNIIISCINNKFKNVPESSKFSKRIADRENDPEEFIKRITPQILECFDNNYIFSTPEEWDNNFNLLGGGQSRRTSKAILKRMTWDQFLYNSELIIRENRL